MPTIEVTEHEKMILDGLRGMLSQSNAKQLETVEELYFAKSKQTLYTKKELAKRWGCTTPTVDNYLKTCCVQPVDKSGKEFLFDLEEAEESKRIYTKEKLSEHRIETRVRAMAN